MPRVMVTTRNGEVVPVQAAGNGTLMEAIRDNGINELQAVCGGCCSCATCHVYVDSALAERIPAMTEDEDGLLDGSAHRRPTSRLSCQIRLTDNLNDLHVTIAPED